MPIYEYECSACGHQFEEWQKITEPPVSMCPSCGKEHVQRLVSATAFQLKGQGWYVTDYKSGSSSTGSASKRSGDSADSKTAETKTDKSNK